MKILLSALTIFCLILFNSCKSDSGGGGGAFGTGPGGGGGVTFAITQGQGAQGIIFYANPSAAITVDSIHVSVGTSSGTLTGNNTVYPANVKFEIQEFTIAAAGQAWTFVFMGKLGSATGTAYTATSNYTVQ